MIPTHDNIAEARASSSIFTQGVSESRRQCSWLVGLLQGNYRLGHFLGADGGAQNRDPRQAETVDENGKTDHVAAKNLPS